MLLSIPGVPMLTEPGSALLAAITSATDLYGLPLFAAFVLTTVVSVHAGTATLDAGSKAISPDKPMSERFRWSGRIISMSEEHTVIEADDLKVGDRLFLMPQHTCTTAYLYDHALVKTSAGPWEQRQQLGSKR